MQDNVKIRRTRPGDNSILEKVIKGVFEEFDAPKTGTVYSDPTTSQLYELFDVPGSVLWVAEADGVVAGCCGVYPTTGLEPGTAELVKFYLDASFRGRGIGKALIQKSMASAVELGYNRLYIESLPEFATAVGMYESLGFERISHALGNSGHTSCNVWMVKRLV